MTQPISSVLQTNFSFLLFLLLLLLLLLQTPKQLLCDSLTTAPSSSISKNTTTTTTFLWNSLVEVPSDTFSTAFLPAYVNFTGDDVLLNDHLSEGCREAVALSLAALTARQLWPARLFNSWAKFPPSGTLVGTLVDFGDYDQCLAGRDDDDKEEGDDGEMIGAGIASQSYCLVDVALPMPRPMPHQHNYFHPTKGLLPKDRLEVEEFRVTLAGNASAAVEAEQLAVYLANGSVYRHLEHISSVFYYEDIQIGVCWPANCSQQDVTEVMGKGKCLVENDLNFVLKVSLSLQWSRGTVLSWEG